MRNAFIKRLLVQAEKDASIFLLVGDLGYSVVEPFAETFPDRYLNVGVAEQNMTGMAAGLAREGYKVFTYSIANFNTLRCLEQIRNDICYHHLDVTVVSVGGGLSYGNLGYSHFAVQDIAILSTLPSISLLLPGDPLETRWCVDYAISTNEPKYLRLGKAGEPMVHNEHATYAPISAIEKQADAKIALIGISNILPTAKAVYDRIIKNQIPVDLFSIPVVNESFTKMVRESFSAYKQVFTIEEHVKINGLGSQIVNILNETQVVNIGLDKNFCKLVGSQSFLREKAGLGVDDLTSTLLKTIEQ
jgi:transketolase